MEVYEMDQKMFCYQCEQTAGCAGCTGSTGVCGKTAETARLQDQLVGAMIGLARAAEGVECPGDRVYRTVIEGEGAAARSAGEEKCRTARKGSGRVRCGSKCARYG